jgi:catechol 2,3-dioxygenase-like lactoylglutathione lyase family enzyme
MSDASASCEIVRPTLHHFGLTTANLEAMLDWYGRVLGMTSNHQTSKPLGARGPSGVRVAWVSNDEANHRIAIVELPGLVDDSQRTRARGEWPGLATGILARDADEDRGSHLGAVRGGRARCGGMGRPPAGGVRRPRPVCRCAPAVRPPLAGPCDATHSRQSAPGRPLAGDCPANPAPEIPRAGASSCTLC